MAVLDSSHSQGASHRLRQAPRALWVLLALALAMALALELRLALQSPGEAIRGELEAAAADLQSPSAVPSERVLGRLHRHFRGRDVTIDAALWPLVTVTFKHLDAATCRDAAEKAGRIEGLVVIALEHDQGSGACRGTNNMTWRIMP